MSRRSRFLGAIWGVVWEKRRLITVGAGITWAATWALFLRRNLWALRFNTLIWGVVWAICLQRTRWGKWLALHRTWLTVVIGVGVNLGLLFFVLPRRAWVAVAEVFALSSIGIIARSLINEFLTDAN